VGSFMDLRKDMMVSLSNKKGIRYFQSKKKGKKGIRYFQSKVGTQKKVSVTFSPKSALNFGI